MVGAYLVQNGFAFQHAISGAAGLDALRDAAADPFAAVLLDLMLPGEDGLQLARTLLAPETARSFDQYLAQGTNHTFALDRPVPVYIVYFTAVADPAATSGVAYLDDVYGRDAGLAKAA